MSAFKRYDPTAFNQLLHQPATIVTPINKSVNRQLFSESAPGNIIPRASDLPIIVSAVRKTNKIVKPVSTKARDLKTPPPVAYFKKGLKRPRAPQ